MLPNKENDLQEERAERLTPIRASLVVRLGMRPMTEVLNPLVRKLAGRRHFPMAAQLHHVGRRTGRQYVTPVAARLKGDQFLIPLTFGNQSDWARNVSAAKGCIIRVNGQTYDASEPEFLNWSDAAPLVRSVFGVTRFSFRLLGIKQFMRLRVQSAPKEPTISDAH
jgi:deazaflavin-dependent oxidoreductase (nitroreductase family)